MVEIDIYNTGVSLVANLQVFFFTLTYNPDIAAMSTQIERDGSQVSTRR